MADMQQPDQAIAIDNSGQPASPIGTEQVAPRTIGAPEPVPTPAEADSSEESQPSIPVAFGPKSDEPKKPVVNIGAYLQSKGYGFSRADENGNVWITTPTGDEARFDANAFLKKKGIDPDKMDVQFNDPKAALDISPLSVGDRAKMALGNVKGSVNYLKNKFDQVAVDPDQGIIVKNKGVWFKVDADWLGDGDPWQMAKELGKDITEGAVRYVPTALLSTAGAAGGGVLGAVGGPPGIAGGSIVGAGLGGAAGEGIRTSLGRIVGTYDATPEEQLKDIGWETILNMGGQGIALGVKPALSMLRNALKPLSERALPAVKDAFSQFWGLTTGAGAPRIRYALDSPDAVISSLAKVSKGSSAIEMENMLKDHTINEARLLMSPARKALSSTFGQMQKDFSNNVPASMEFRVGDIIKETQQSMETAGLGKVVEKNGVSKFELFGQEEIEKNLAKGNIPDVVDKKSLEAIGSFVDEMNKFSNVPALKGKAGAESVLKIKRALSDSYYSITDDAAPNIKRAVAQFSSQINQTIGSAFERSKVPGLADRYTAMSNLYSKYSGAVGEADRMLREVNGAEIFVNKLTSGAGANRTLKGVAGDLAELLGPEGEKRIQSILAADSARGFVGYMPNLGKLTTAGAAATGAGVATMGAAAPMGAAIAATQSSPRLVLKQIQYANKFKDLVSGMSPGARDQFLRNPQLVNGAMGTMFRAYEDEDKKRDQILKQSGVIQ